MEEVKMSPKKEVAGFGRATPLGANRPHFAKAFISAQQIICIDRSRLTSELEWINHHLIA